MFTLGGHWWCWLGSSGGACKEGGDHGLSGHEVRLELVDQLCRPEHLGCHAGHSLCGGGDGLCRERHLVRVGGAGLVLVLCRLEGEADLGVGSVEGGGGACVN